MHIVDPALAETLLATYGYAAIFVLAGANRFSPFRFFVLNTAGGIAWATVFGLGGYLFGEGIHRIAGPIDWAALVLALVAAFILWRFFKSHEEQLLANAEAAVSNASQQRP
jgi:membrane protein DedA with SNARE-associated domain